MYRIRRFGVVRTANIAALMYVVIVLIVFVPLAVIVALVAPSTTGFGNAGSSSAFLGTAGAAAVLFLGLVFALFYGVVGWIFTAIACLLYNVAARMIGGIEIQLEFVEPPTPTPAWGGLPTAPPPAPPPSSSPPGAPLG